MAETGDFVASASAYPALLAVMHERLGPAHWRTIESTGRYAWCLMQQDRHDEAFEQLIVAMANSRATNGDTHTTTRGLARYIATSAVRVLPVERAAPMIDRVAGQIFDQNTSDRRLADAACTLGEALARAGDAAGAERWRGRCTRVAPPAGTP